MDLGSMDKVKEVFRRFDKDNNKMISKMELKRILQLINHVQVKDADLEVMLKSADVGGDGSINYDEFVHWVFGSSQGQWLEGEGVKMVDKPEPQLSAAVGRLHVLIIEGSSHPGRLLTDSQFMGLPLHFDLLHAAFHQLPQAVITSMVNPWKSKVPSIIRDFAASIPAGDMSMLIFTGHGVQARGEQYLVFESRGGCETLAVEPLSDPDTGRPYAPREFRLRERMQHIDAQISEKMGADWISQGWTISSVDGDLTGKAEFNHAVVEVGKANRPFELIFSKGEKTIDFVSYDELRALFAGGPPSVHFIDACRVVHDDALGFASGESAGDAVASREAKLRESPVPENVISVFAVKPGAPAMHEGAGRNYNRSKMELGHEMEAEGILQSDYARQIMEEWEQANAEEGTILQYYTSFFVEAFVDCVGELHLEGKTARVGDLLQRMTCCPFGRVRKMRGFRTFVGDNPVLEAGSGRAAAENFALRFQGEPFVVPEVEDE